MRVAALLATVLGVGCAAARTVGTPEPRGEWRMVHRETDGHVAGAARLGPGGWIVFEFLRAAAPLPSVLEVKEERRLAAVGEEIRVRVRVDPRADPGVYLVRAASDACFAGPAELTLEPGLEGTFRLYSERPGAAEVQVALMEVIRHVDAAAGVAARRPR